MNQITSLELLVLGALLRLARRSEEATFSAIELRVASEPSELRNALRRLEGRGLIERRATDARLLMPGFVVAVACAGKARPASSSTERRTAAQRRSSQAA